MVRPLLLGTARRAGHWTQADCSTEYVGIKLAQSSPRKEDLRNDTFGHKNSKPFSGPDSEKGSLANETYSLTNLMLVVPTNATSLLDDTWMYQYRRITA